MVRVSSAKGLFTSSILVLTSLFSYGATVARLILVQKIVVRIHVGKPGIWEATKCCFWTGYPALHGMG